MKLLKRIPLLLTVMVLAFSCSIDQGLEVQNGDGEQSRDFTAIFTVRRSASGEVYLQVNDSTRLYALNWQNNNEGVVRMIGGITVMDHRRGSFAYMASVQWAETIEEGRIVRQASAGDPVDVLEDWMTGAEDGFLTLHYSTWWGSRAVAHSFSLVMAENPDDPYEVRLVHGRNGDAADEQGDALVCFDLGDLPDTGGEYKILTLKWKDGEGKDAERKYSFRSRSSSD